MYQRPPGMPQGRATSPWLIILMILSIPITFFLVNMFINIVVFPNSSPRPALWRSALLTGIGSALIPITLQAMMAPSRQPPFLSLRLWGCGSAGLLHTLACMMLLYGRPALRDETLILHMLKHVGSGLIVGSMITTGVLLCQRLMAGDLGGLHPEYRRSLWVVWPLGWMLLTVGLVVIR